VVEVLGDRGKRAPSWAVSPCAVRLWIAESMEFHDPVCELANHEDPGGVQQDLAEGARSSTGPEIVGPV
jgi:hypothetical protein